MKVIIALCVLICVANAASIKWTGLEQNNQWTSSVNWYPAQVPGPNDDVTIEFGNVLCTISTGVNSLTMGDNVNDIANLTIFQSFAIASTAEINVNGNLIVNAGSASLTGTVNVDGHLLFQSGTVGGQITITSKGVGDLSGGAFKNLVGAGFTNQGTVLLSGGLLLNQSSIFTNTGTVTATGSLQLQAGDTTSTVFDTSAGSFTYNGGAGNKLRLMVTSNFNVLGFQSGDITSLGPVNIAGDLVIPTGSTFKTEADGNTTFGGDVSGTGSLNIGGKLTTFNTVNVSSVTVPVGYVNFNGALNADTLEIDAGTVNFNAASSANAFTIVGGNINFYSTVTASTVSVQGGILSGSGGFAATTSASLASQGINLATTFTLGGSLSFSAKTLIAFATGGAIVVSSGANVTVDSALTLTGPPGAGSFTNNGAVSVTSGLSTANIDLLGTGAYTVSGTITTSSCKLNAATITLSAGSVTGQTTAINVASIVDSDSTGNVDVTVGDYSFSCPGSCSNVVAKASGQVYKFSTSS